MIADAVATARAAAVTGQVMVRADSAYYPPGRDRRRGAGQGMVSVTVRMNQAVRQAIAGIPERAWTTIKYPRAIWDTDEQRFISEAEVAEATLTAFTSHPIKRQVTCRLVVLSSAADRGSEPPGGANVQVSGFRGGDMAGNA